MTLGALTGCDGEGDTPSKGAAPTLTLNMAASAESGEIIPIGVTVTDDEDRGLTYSLACNGGALTGTMLTLPAVTAGTNVECTATATDSKGNVGTAKKTIAVRPASVSLISYTDSEEVLAAGGIGLLFAENLTLDQAQYQGSFNGKAIPLYRINGNELIYAVPLDTPAGTGDLTVQIGSRVIRTRITTGAAITVANARDQVTSFLRNAKANVEDLIATPGIGSAERTTLQGALPDLDQALTRIATASDADVGQFASRLAALGLITPAATRRLANYEPIVTGPTCRSDRTHFGKTVTGMVVGALLLGKGSVAAFEGSALLGLPWLGAVAAGVSISAGATMFINYGRQFNPSRKAFWQSCWTETTINLVPFNSDSFTSTQRVAAIALPGTSAFRPKVSRSFKLERAFAPVEEARAQANQFLTDISGVIGTLSSLWPDLKQELEQYRVTGSEAVPAGRLSLSGISSGLVTGSAAANGDLVTLTFNTSAKPADLTNGKLPFSFSLLREGEESVQITAELAMALPEAFDAAVEVTQGQAASSSVRTSGAETLQVTTQPGNGRVVLQNDGTFSYTPTGMFFGQDQFKYVARNADGTSAEATVLVNVVRRFEGTWTLTIMEDTTSESTPGLCPDQRHEVVVNVSKISDSAYSANYAGLEIILAMASKDDPRGLAGARSYTVEDDGEAESGNVTIGIPDSQTLHGRNLWTWNASGKMCLGTTTITGRR
ncbi:hypothetical protein GRI97_10880 [Altererythrobacter xixiisoli]|uniref:Bacterial Ig-like domain-containing protein n=1 Tax=Croceibacterium xixiisoli TaxID=1476466 RepID=A0A6I4TUL1_9SPHN|nr:Ig-like domain-containing protein [Croceibacterium xixiisoli]MXO99492.1 hypothetical protein [Croceibacterium xixiisoli]